MVDWGRLGTGLYTLGLSEAGRAMGANIPSVGDAKDWLLGGKATEGIDPKPANYDYATSQLQSMVNTSQNRRAPTAQMFQLGPAAQLAGGPQDQARQGMQGVAGRLGAMATGAAPGAGEMAVNRQVGQAQAGQTSLARMARGANAALALRNAGRNSADIGLAGAGQAAGAQMQDQQMANQQLGQIYGAMRGQDLDFAGQNAQLQQQQMLQQGQFGQQANLANQQAALQQRQMNDAYQIQALGQMLGWDQATIDAQLKRAAIAAGDKGMLPALMAGGAQVGAAAASGGMK